MRTYRQVTEFEPKIAELLARHADRLIASTPPRGLWVCEEDGEPLIVLTVYTEPHTRISAIIDEPEKKPFSSLTRLAQTFEEWALKVGVRHYGIVIDKHDDHYCKIIEKRGGIVMQEDSQWVEYLHEIDQTRDTSDGIRPWRPSDWRSLRPLMSSFLNEHYAVGGDFRPTRRNTEAFIRKGVKAAAKNDPCLLAYDGGELVGFCIWAGLPDGGLDLRERICLGLGTYIIPTRRRQGWSKRIREAAKEVASAAGYTRLDGVALDKRGLKAGEAVGGQVVGVAVRLQLAREERKVA